MLSQTWGGNPSHLSAGIVFLSSESEVFSKSKYIRAGSESSDIVHCLFWQPVNWRVLDSGIWWFGWYIGGYWGFSTESKTPVTFVLPIGCWPLEMPAMALKFVLKPQSLPALYQTKPPNAGIMLTPVIWLAAKSETLDTGTTFRVGSITLGFPSYLASGTGEDNVGAETTDDNGLK